VGKIPPIQHIPETLALTDTVLEEAAVRFETPLYVYDGDLLESNWQRLRAILPPPMQLFYSVKANPNLALMRICHRLGAWFEVASGGELLAAMRAGVLPGELIFVAPGKSQSELEEAISQDLCAIVAESAHEVALLDAIAEQSGQHPRVALRVNLGIAAGSVSMAGPTQFGMTQDEACQLFMDAHSFPHLQFVGIHSYQGTGILDTATILSSIERILVLAENLQSVTGVKFSFVDVGGGFGIPYHEADVAPTWEDLKNPLRSMVTDYLLRHPETRVLAAESGRFIVGPAGVFVTRVLDVKQIAGKEFVITDGGMNVYGAGDRYYGSRPVPIRVIGGDKRELHTVTVCGPLCTPTDRMAANVLLPVPEIGDLMATYQAGAYELTASPGRFLSHEYPAEALFYNQRLTLIRKRETAEQLLRSQQIPLGVKDAAWKGGNYLRRLPPDPFAVLEQAREAYERSNKELIDLSRDDPDQPPPASILVAFQRALQDPASHGHPPLAGLRELREAIERWYWRRFGVQLDPEHEVLVLPGGKEGLAHLPLALCDPGDVVLVPDPGHPVYASAALAADAHPYTMPATAASGFLPDLRSIPASTARRSRLLYLNFPNNPTGAVAPLSYFAEVIEFARSHNAVVCHDSAYSELYFDGDPPHSIFEIPGAKEVAVEVHSLAKTFCMTRWPVGMIVGNREVIAALSSVRTVFDSGVFPAVQRAAIHALEGGDKLTADLRSLYARRRAVTVNGLHLLGWSITLPPASCYIWAPIPNRMPAAEFVEQCLVNAGVLMTPGTAFGRGGEGFVRMTLNAEVTSLERAIGKLESWFATSPFTPLDG